MIANPTRTTCPRDCYDACGVLVLRRGGRLVVRGDPDHPVSRGTLCRKCSIAYNGVLLDPSARLTSPLRRVGPKGEGKFEPIAWDEALREIGARLGAVIADHGGASVANVHYTGTCSLLAYAFGLRLVRRIGATEVEPDTVCNLAGQTALEYVYGTAVTGFDPRAARDAASVVVWGANPSVTGPHQHEHWLPEAPGTTIVIDPISTPTAKLADIHLQPFPGTDAALAFGLAHVLHRARRVDRDFLAAHAVGWNELEPLLAPCTPAWTEEQTGVSAALVEEAARAYGRGPSLVWIGQGLQRQPLGGNVVRAVAMLPAICGHLGKPGGGFLYLNGPRSRGIDGAYLAATHLGPDPPTIGHMDLAAQLEDAARFKAMLVWNMNPAASNPEQARLREALRRDDLFTVAIDLFPTDTTDFADVVLPAASFLEFDDLVKSYFHLSLSAQVKATDPSGEALPNSEIFRRLATALGYDEPELHEPDRRILDTLLERTGLGVDWDELAERGTIWISEEPIVQFAELTFPTPSSKVELASDRAEADGHPRTPLPLVDARPEGRRLRLLSPASEWLMNASFANEPKIARQLGRASIAIHPDEATARSLEAGDEVRVESTTGSLRLDLVLSDDVPPGVAYAPKGRWPRIDASGANVNVLVSARKTDMGESTCVHGTEVTVTLVGAE